MFPNFAAPKSKASKYPHTIRGIVKNKSCDQFGNSIGFVILVSSFIFFRFEFERFGVTPLRAGLAPARPQRCLVFCGPFGGIQRGALGIAECSGWGAVPRDVVCQDHSHVDEASKRR